MMQSKVAKGRTECLLAARLLVLSGLASPRISMATRRSIAAFLALGAILVPAGCSKDRVVGPCVRNCGATYPVIESAESLIRNFELAYKNRDFDKFQALLANQPDAQYFFYLSPDTPPGEDHFWGYTEEVRIHRRMFRPKNPLPGETPVPPEKWLQDVTITLTQLAPFAERHDLYRSGRNPGGLDSLRWRAKESTYLADVFFQLAGEVDYQIKGKENFVVIEDLTKAAANAPGKWLFYRWEDVGYPAQGVGWSQGSLERASVNQSSWGSVKALYSR